MLSNTEIAKNEDAAVDLYIGGAIEHNSEREVLKALVEHLSSTGDWAIVFANTQIGGRQIDFVVATESLTLVIEAKHFSRDIRGKVNGLWEMRMCGGAWRHVGNPYLQALEAKNALRDQLRRIDGQVSGYPDACVVFAPRLSERSEVPSSDYKVAIVDLQHIASLLSKRSGSLWSRDKWMAYAQELRLQRIQNLNAAFSSKLLEQEKLLAAYHLAFFRTYEPDIVSFQSDSYLVGSSELAAEHVANRIINRDEDLLIRGPSGCGKTLLAKQTAIHCLRNGYVPIFLYGKYFTGKLRESIEREVSLLGARSVTDLMVAAKRLGRSLIFVVDGYNECPSAEQLTLTRSLVAAARRYSARLVISSQTEIARQDLLDATNVLVTEPDRALKTAIAEASSEGIGHRLGYLLDSISTGLEADLVGRVGTILPEGSSRFALFDAYARQKLGDEASDGIRLMAAMARQLIERLTFSMSIRDLDRLAAAEGIHGHVLGRIITAGLLLKRGDRVSFRHELIFAAFSAESVVRQANHDVEDVLAALISPKYRVCRMLIVGAIDDRELVDRVLERTMDAELLRAALEGECGLAAQRWVSERCARAIEKMTLEAAGLEFSLREDSWGGAGACGGSVYEWSPTERALMAAIADGVWRGPYLEPILDAVAVMDKSLNRGFVALREEAKAKKIALRTALFADAYVMSRHRAGLPELLAHVGNNGPFFRSGERQVVERLKTEWSRPRTAGQTHLLLILIRVAEDSGFVLPHILPLLGEQWKYQPYHLQLALLNFVHFVHPPDESSKRRLVEALEALLPRVGPILSGIVLEALERMGALEQESAQHIDTVRQDLRELLSGAVDSGTYAQAWGMYVSQFDHPFSTAYCEAIQELSQDESKCLLTMACQGAEHAGLFVAPLIQELVAHQDPGIAPALERWASLPKADSFMPQEAVSIFVWAHIALGKLNVPLPKDRGPAHPAANAALLACGELYYWINRTDLSVAEIDAACEFALNMLLRNDQFGSASALHMVTRSLTYENAVRMSIVNRFPGPMLAVCRKALQRPEGQVGYFPHFIYDKLDVLHFSIGMVGDLGCLQDLPILRDLSQRHDIGYSAIKAIQLIDERANSLNG